MDKLKGTIPRKVNMSKLKPVGIPEASIQQAVENYLHIKGIRFIHVPSEIYRCAADGVTIKLGRFNMTWGVKNAIRDSLKGIPDLMLFKKQYYPIGDEHIEQKNFVGMKTLWIELKKKNAKARKSQLSYHQGLKVHVVDNVEDAIKLITKWEEE